MRKLFYLTIILSAGLLAACKKEKKTPIVTGTTTTASTLDLIKDSVYLYFKEDNFWHAAAPDYASFNPRAITGTNDIGALETELDKLSQFAINPATGKPYEYYASAPGHAKYSFMDDGTTAAALNGTKGDFGFNALYNQVSDLRIKYVYPGSPAALAGIRRGYQITSINGSASIAYDGGTGPGTNLAFVNNAIFNSSTITMTLKKYDGTTLTVTNMSTGSYTVNPVLKDTVYATTNGHKVGYIVFNSFTSGSNATPVLNAAFNYFTTQGVTDLVVDLRYNGGGYVSTAEYLDNLIVPTGKTGLMYNTYYTDNLANGKDPLLRNQWHKDGNGTDFNYAQIDFSLASNAVNFSKQGSLNVARVFFIISGSTASASELTINNLRPVMDVQFIGRKSYGKPVGFFDIHINKYTMYTPEFSTKNSVGQGDYYDGFNPGDTAYPGVNDFDDATKDFGDPTEVLLAHALHFVTLGTYAVQNPVTQGVGTKTLRVQQSGDMGLDPHAFKGMIFDKKLKLKK